ncbi:MAG: MinD/ParA family protein [Lachnospiraceae bacterium]|nr:MinD/ParA family protein [Lachnospiraceae bacterium]
MDQAENLRRQVRQNDVSFERKTEAARVITVTSGKGGVGKSSVTVNLAIQLSRLGKRVIVFDADFGLANIEVMLGLRPEYNLADLMFRGKSLKDIITYGPENIGFISGGSGINELANMSKEQIYSLIQRLYELDMMADVIIVDTGAGISNAVLEFVAASEEVLLVATSEPTSITDAYALLKSLNRNSTYAPEKTTIKMIANEIRNEKEAEELFEKLNVVVNKFLNIDMEFLGSIPYDVNMQKAVMKQMPVSMTVPNSPSAKAIQQIVEKTWGDNWAGKKESRGIMQVFTNIIHLRMK